MLNVAALILKWTNAMGCIIKIIQEDLLKVKEVVKLSRSTFVQISLLLIYFVEGNVLVTTTTSLRISFNVLQEFQLNNFSLIF